MDYTQAIRKTVVTKIHVHHRKVGNPLYPMVESDIDAKEHWTVFVYTRAGLLPEAVTFWTFHSEADASTFVARHPVGTEFDLASQWVGYEEQRLRYVRTAIDSKTAPFAGNSVGEDSPLAFDVLDNSGLTSRLGDITPMVRDSLGKRRIGELKNKFNDNWKVAAVFEYCCLNLPTSSPAYTAALYQYHYCITMDDFAAGYARFVNLPPKQPCALHGVTGAAVRVTTLPLHNALH
jgi:hypothetical protein